MRVLFRKPGNRISQLLERRLRNPRRRKKRFNFISRAGIPQEKKSNVLSSIFFSLSTPNDDDRRRFGSKMCLDGGEERLIFARIGVFSISDHMLSCAVNIYLIVKTHEILTSRERSLSGSGCPVSVRACACARLFPRAPTSTSTSRLHGPRRVTT